MIFYIKLCKNSSTIKFNKYSPLLLSQCWYFHLVYEPLVSISVSDCNLSVPLTLFFFFHITINDFIYFFWRGVASLEGS